jgi:Domain of unknown function (DUF6431)
MSQQRLPPPDPEACLVRLRPSTQKGGTLIAEDVTDWATHDRRICNPDGYRPPCCPRCGERRLHVHDYRERQLRADPDTPVATIVRHACVACAAIWQILPAFIARHLWRTWDVVAHTVTEQEAPSATGPQRGPTIPARTARRWRARWQRPVRALTQILAASGAAAWAALAGRLPPDATCADLITGYIDLTGLWTGPPLAAVAALLYRLQPSVRLL